VSTSAISISRRVAGNARHNPLAAIGVVLVVVVSAESVVFAVSVDAVVFVLVVVSVDGVSVVSVELTSEGVDLVTVDET